jgi:hypothetical protein
MLVERYVAAADYPEEEIWRLVEWCRTRGATEFTVECLGEPDAPVWAGFERVVSPYALGEQIRRRMSARTADDLTRQTELWALNDATIGALRQAFPRGVLEYYPADEGWFENLVLYRDGELMFGAITHEHAAVLRITELEHAELAAAGFRSHDELPYIGY